MTSSKLAYRLGGSAKVHVDGEAVAGGAREHGVPPGVVGRHGEVLPHVDRDAYHIARHDRPHDGQDDIGHVVNNGWFVLCAPGLIVLNLDVEGWVECGYTSVDSF